MIAILYNIRSAHNVGSIFRTSDAAGVEKIYLCGITPAPVDEFGRVNKDIAKTALGGEKYVKWEKVNARGVGKLIESLKSEGYEILAVEQAKDSIPYHKFNRMNRADKTKRIKKENRKIALIMGNEVKGLSKSILNKADKILEIPMYGRKESLNVAVAFGVVVFGLLHHGTARNKKQNRC